MVMVRSSRPWSILLAFMLWVVACVAWVMANVMLGLFLLFFFKGHAERELEKVGIIQGGGAFSAGAARAGLVMVVLLPLQVVVALLMGHKWLQRSRTRLAGDDPETE